RAGSGEGQANRTNRTVTLFTNNNFSRAFIGRVRVVDLVTVNKQDQVSILLNSAGFAQVTHYRTFVGALLQASVQLRQSNQGTIQFFGQTFQGTTDFRNFRCPVLATA